MRDLGSLRSECERRLQGITVPQPFDLGAFTAGIARQRGRPVELRELPGDASGAVTGAWIATGRANIVYYERSASRWHRDLIVLHEFAHMLCDHPADATWGRDLLARLVPDLSEAAIRRMLGRHGYTRDDELQAEDDRVVHPRACRHRPSPGGRR